ncbi:hypothetical protein Clacol_002919 [Clathrus columnatus]|uniref:Protein kinase domain-containing protein n=1 Tax=Clathrus columnatus TaxID=1419009 RepID=A0AAV5A372_9AGAM|nr:hypothetical protein Clacol_002919 [Clathrus columnatus]
MEILKGAVLTDFGILPRMQADIESTSDPLPSLRWFAPELLIDGDSMSIRTDIYSLGSTILELVTGELPYQRLNEIEVLQKVLQRCSPAETAIAFRYHISENLGLLYLLNRCWSSPPERPSIDEIAEFFQSLQAQEPEPTHPFHPPPAYSPPSRSQTLVPEL